MGENRTDRKDATLLRDLMKMPLREGEEKKKPWGLVDSISGPLNYKTVTRTILLPPLPLGNFFDIKG